MGKDLKIAQQNTYIKNISPHSTHCTARVRVLEKSFPRTPYHALQKYQRLIFVDGQIISTRTPVSEIPECEAKENLIAAPLSHVPFYIVAAAIVSFPLKTLKSGTAFQEVYLLIKSKLKPKILTLWNEFASNEGEKISQIIQTQPIIVGMRLKVISFSGKILVPQTLPLNCYCKMKKKYSVINNSQAPSTTPMKDPNVANVIQISTLLADDKNASSWWIKASASITNYNQKFWYTGCNVCWRATYADHGQTFTCRNCSGQERVAEARCRFLIELVDSTGTITAMVFGKSAEKIFEVDALKLMQFCDKENEEDASKTVPLKNEEEVEASTCISIQPNDGAKAPIIANN
ncbi:Replication protein A 70 kDa DNA-binding subunit B [Bienertia sinuspersici]